MPEGRGSIKGGLPVIAVISCGGGGSSWFGEDEYWEEIHIYWVKKDGTKGAEIPQKVMDQAEKYDPCFCCLSEQVWDDIRIQQYEAEHGHAYDAAPMHQLEGPNPNGR